MKVDDKKKSSGSGAREREGVGSVDRIADETTGGM